MELNPFEARLRMLQQQDGVRMQREAAPDEETAGCPGCPYFWTCPVPHRGEEAPRMSTPQQRVRDATRRLLEHLATGESLGPEAIELRAELAEATAEAGQLEDAYYQVEELLKDAQRHHGPDDAAVLRARAAVETVRTIGLRAAEQG
jgi:hypothetical protein